MLLFHLSAQRADLTERAQERGEERGRRTKRQRERVSYYTLFTEVPPPPPPLPPPHPSFPRSSSLSPLTRQQTDHMRSLKHQRGRGRLPHHSKRVKPEKVRHTHITNRLHCF